MAATDATTPDGRHYHCNCLDCVTFRRRLRSLWNPPIAAVKIRKWENITRR